jgi:hypothetical protein
VLEDTKTRVGTTRLSKSDPMSDADARALLAAVDEVIISKGKASRTQKAKATELDDLRGHTGNFRAPMVRVKRTLLVGFHDEALRAVLARS